jgi:geranylgeranyl reductase family protein
VTAPHFDVAVIGAGPAGSIAALVLARGGARVALVDKATFPRDKACGDLVGPRGVQALEELDVRPTGEQVGDMEVVGPSGGRAVLRARSGLTYPGFGIVVPRRRLDAHLRQSALAAGAGGIDGQASTDTARATDVRVDRPGQPSLHLRADVVIGADGALSRVGQAAGLVDERRVLWGFALRGYASRSVERPEIWFWEPARWRGYPGYGWVFPGEDGSTNIGIGIGMRGDRRAATRVARDLDAFAGAALERRLGGWLKMGMVGTVPAAGRTLLVGDAAGLVNSLQGEGIAQAIISGRTAAESILKAGPDGAAAAYRHELGARYAAYAASTAPLTEAMIAHPRAVSMVGRTLTAPGIRRVVAGAWSVSWNDLLDGAVPGWPRTSATWAAHLFRAATARTEAGRSVHETSWATA